MYVYRKLIDIFFLGNENGNDDYTCKIEVEYSIYHKDITLTYIYFFYFTYPRYRKPDYFLKMDI